MTQRFHRPFSALTSPSTKSCGGRSLEGSCCEAFFFSLRSFDRAGRREFKFLPTTETNLEFFFQFTYRNGLGEEPVLKCADTASLALQEGTFVSTPSADVQVLWPCWIERMLHLFDDCAEAHFFPEQGSAFWWVRWAHESELKWFVSAGRRLLTMRGPEVEGAWDFLAEELR